MDGPRERMESQYTTREERPRLSQRAYSGRMLRQSAGSSHQYSSRVCQARHVQIQPDGSFLFVTRSFDDGVGTHLSRRNLSNASRISVERSSGDSRRTTSTNLQLDPSLRVPPRPPPRYISYQPGRPIHQSTAPRCPIDPQGVDPRRSSSTLSGSLHGKPKLERKKSGFHEKRNRPYKAESDKNGSFSRAGDRHVSSRQHPRRSASMSTVSLDSRKILLPRSQARKGSFKSSCDRSKEKSKKSPTRTDSIGNKKQFKPQKSASIYRKFDKKVAPKNNQNDDIWVEKIVLNGPHGRKQSYFQSLDGNKKRSEPPTGASKIIYLEDIIVDKQEQKPAPKKTKSIRHRSQKHEEDPNKSQSQRREIFRSKPRETSRKTPVDETKADNGEKAPKARVKRRASFFNFMKKSENQKNDVDAT